MFITNRFIVYPDDDVQEIEHALTVNQLVDLNGFPLRLPLKTHKIIAYRVFKKTTDERTGEESIYYHLELVPVNELLEFLE